MKTRIISGIVMGAIVAAVLAAGMLWNAIVIILAVAILAAMAMRELTKSIAGIKSCVANIGAAVYAFIATAFMLMLENPIFPKYLLGGAECGFRIGKDYALGGSVVAVLYFVFAVIVCLKNHKEFSLASILMITAMPICLSYAFGSLGTVIIHKNGLYYLLLLFNFSSVCDIGAYFTGVTCGKHKLCPNVSPKKTVEGAVGGIVASVIVSVILALCFQRELRETIWLLALTVPMCIIGMLGDLFASTIKRSVGVKDYGNLIPGHGGILDRLDSMLLIAPVLSLCITSWGIL